MLLSRDNDSNSTNVTSGSNHRKTSGLKLDEVNDLSLLQIESNRIMFPNGRIRIPNGSPIMSSNVRNLFGPNGSVSDGQDLVRGLIFRDSVENESSFDIIEQSEEVIGLLNGDDICVG